MRRELPWELLDRYFAGTATPSEVHEVETWVASAPDRAGELNALRDIWRLGAAPPVDAPAWDTDRAIASLRGHIRADRRVERSVFLRHVAALAAAIVVAIGIVRYRDVILARTFVTAAGQRQRVSLADGTAILLAPGSRLTVRGRDVSLDGEGYFAVRYDAARPFHVHVGAAILTDLGTVFDVRSYPEDQGVRVVVTEGRVGVAPAGLDPRVVLGAGQTTRVSATGIAGVIERADTAALTGWRHGHLEFADVPLRDALSELSRWYDLDLRVRDDVDGARRLTIAFTDAPADDVLHGIARTLGLTYTQHHRTVTFSPAH
jgi:transmembrane sensor